MLRQVFNKIYGSAVVVKQLPSQRRIAYTPIKKIQNKGDARLRSIVRYAAHNVPYYQELFSANKIDYRDIRTTRDLDNLPLITKEMVRDDPDLFISRSREGRNSIPFVTSGTTGTPLRIQHDSFSIISNIAYCEPEKEVTRNLLGRNKNTRRVAIIYSASTLRKIWGEYSKYTWLKPPAEKNMLFVEESFNELIKKINNLKPDVISGYGSHLEALFKYASAHNVRLHRPLILDCGADSMTESGKSFIKETYDTTVLSRYSAVECFRIGFTCEKDEGFHIHQGLCDLKIVDRDGIRVSDGVSGEVVISNLINRGTVLLNYRLGDVAVKSSRQCSCGRSLPLLTDLVGRIEDIVVLRSGDAVHPRVIWNVFKTQSEVVRYQLIQHQYDDFELKIVTKEYAIYQIIIPDILKKLRAVLGNVQISSAHYEQLETTLSGKFRPVVSHCKQK